MAVVQLCLLQCGDHTCVYQMRLGFFFCLFVFLFLFLINKGGKGTRLSRHM